MTKLYLDYLIETLNDLFDWGWSFTFTDYHIIFSNSINDITIYTDFDIKPRVFGIRFEFADDNQVRNALKHLVEWDAFVNRRNVCLCRPPKEEAKNNE